MKRKVFSKIICCVLISLGFLAYFSADWCLEKYGDVGFDAIIFTMFSNLDGVSGGLILDYLKSVVPSFIISVILTSGIILFESKNKIMISIKSKKFKLYPFNKAIAIVLSLLVSTALWADAIITVRADQWIQGNIKRSKIFEEEYVDAENTKITFPKEKRNLIYIFMESMETTFYSTEEGGVLAENVIPEMYELSRKNISFAYENQGIASVECGGWTMAALVSQIGGIPLKLPVGGNEMQNHGKFLPGAYTMNDVLKQNGYYQSFMCGSDVEFGGRDKFFEQHGVDKIYDYYSAQTDGIIPKDYYDDWWGMEDFHLYEYAKQELPKIASQGKPFAFYMLTVDTHHISGHFCEKCETTFSEQYENVYACASRQVNNFIKWLKKQDFYGNTTIVIVGDHLSMDAQYMSRNLPENYNREIYNCIINSAIDYSGERAKKATQLDLFPTTLAALGCKIEGDRLGMGVNLFSEEPTLCQKYGYGGFNLELGKKSRFYDKELLS